MYTFYVYLHSLALNQTQGILNCLLFYWTTDLSFQRTTNSGLYTNFALVSLLIGNVVLLVIPVSPSVSKKATYDKFGEEGLKGGVPQDFGGNGAWSSPYVFHENPGKTFRLFFGGDNPFAGRRYTHRPSTIIHLPTICGSIWYI